MSKPRSIASDKIQRMYFTIGLAVTQWQQVEQALTQLFCILFRPNEGAASAVLTSVMGFRNKLDMIRSAAAVQLSGSDLLDECLNVCDRLERKAKKRNEIVHFMLYQQAVISQAGEIPDPKELEKRIDWYLSPTGFDGAYRWRHDDKPPRLKAVDIHNRALAFIEVSKEIWALSERVDSFLAQKRASP